MRDMHAFGSELAAQTLRQSAQGEFARGEGGAECRALEGGRRAGEDEARRVREGGGIEEEREDGLGEEEGAFATEEEEWC